MTPDQARELQRALERRARAELALRGAAHQEAVERAAAELVAAASDYAHVAHSLAVQEGYEDGRA